ncbi:site-specific DNA-methyltransferase [Listeria monocytogenes]
MNKIELNTIYNEDCLEGMKRIPDNSIDLILTDPPYGTIKSLRLPTWTDETTYWDNAVAPHVLLGFGEKLLRSKAPFIVFSQEPYTMKLRNSGTRLLSFSYPLIWKKQSFGNPLVVKKAPASYFEDLSVFRKQFDTNYQSEERSYARMVSKYIGKGRTQVTKDLGHRKLEHFLCFDTSQFAIPTKSAYEEFIKYYQIDAFEWCLSYEELQKIKSDARPTFNLRGQNHKSNILEYKKELNSTFHPTQKPVALIKDLIETYTNEGDTVLDPFMGSGTTAIACLETNRNFIGFELDESYYTQAIERIKEYKI